MTAPVPVPSPGARLRAAARQLRHAAQDATPGPWSSHTAGTAPFLIRGVVTADAGGEVVIGRDRDAAYVWTVQPAVALAVADLLAAYERATDLQPPHGTVLSAALAVADAVVTHGRSAVAS